MNFSGSKQAIHHPTIPCGKDPEGEKLWEDKTPFMEHSRNGS